MNKNITNKQGSRKKNFPPVYVLASAKSGKQQTRHFRLLKIQFVSLCVASSITVFCSYYPTLFKIASAGYLVFVALSLAALYCSIKKEPEKLWYESRALTESVKTMTWRFIMGAEPFNSHYTDEQVESHFIGELNRIWELNEMGDKEIDDTLKEIPQVTEWMKNVRDSSFKEKKCYYCNTRIQSQLSWYKQKSAFNKNRAILFSKFSGTAYLLAMAVACLQLIDPSCHIPNWLSELPKWLSEPLLVMAAGLLGWAQAKRYSKLASSYSLTSREISRLQERMIDVTEEQFGDFVNDAETAFSREHTQWAARQIKIIAEKTENSVKQVGLGATNSNS